MKIFLLWISVCVAALALSGCSGYQSAGIDNNSVASVNYTFTQRGYYHARLEIPDQVMHGAGQSQDAFSNYTAALGQTRMPLIYKAYVGLKDDIDAFFSNLMSELNSYSSRFGTYLIPEIGLAMTTDGTPSGHYEQDVAAGLYDSQIDLFCQGLSQLGHPVFIRIGYEFNGTGWNGYVTNTYKQAFIRITDKIRAMGLEAATVWCCAPAGPMNNLMDYYPGDSYVDWWGIDLFNESELTLPAALSFITNADAHGKPVMIPETTPKNVGVLNGSLSWNTWFKPFFNLIGTYSNIKAFCYIDWNWADYPQWADWGDARIEQNVYVKSQFTLELASPLYFHATNESAFRKTLVAQDTTAPSQVSGLTAFYTNGAVNLTWSPATDASAIIRYEVRRNSVLIGISVSANHIDRTIEAGDNSSFTVRAVDEAGNSGTDSLPAAVLIPTPLQKILNREFDQGLTSWIIRNYSSGTLSASIDTASVLTGANSVKLITGASNTQVWHSQFGQSFVTHSGKSYIVSFTAKADSAAVIDLFIQQTHEPYQSILIKSISLTAVPQVYTLTNTTSAVEDRMILTFMTGLLHFKSLWIDSICVTEQ